jgi:hypothetical protein
VDRSHTEQSAGTQDTNMARVEMTNDYIFQCQNIFLVAAIHRAITNDVLKSAMNKSINEILPLELKRTGRYINVSIVCTKSHVYISLCVELPFMY